MSSDRDVDVARGYLETIAIELRELHKKLPREAYDSLQAAVSGALRALGAKTLGVTQDADDYKPVLYVHDPWQLDQLRPSELFTPIELENAVVQWNPQRRRQPENAEVNAWLERAPRERCRIVVSALGSVERERDSGKLQVFVDESTLAELRRLRGALGDRHQVTVLVCVEGTAPAFKPRMSDEVTDTGVPSYPNNPIPLHAYVREEDIVMVIEPRIYQFDALPCVVVQEMTRGDKSRTALDRAHPWTKDALERLHRITAGKLPPPIAPPVEQTPEPQEPEAWPDLLGDVADEDVQIEVHDEPLLSKSVAVNDDDDDATNKNSEPPIE